MSKLQLCYNFYVLATNPVVTTNIYHYTKNLCDYKERLQEKNRNKSFFLSSRFPFLQLFVYRYAIIKKSRFHRGKTAKIRVKFPLYLIYILCKCLKMYKLHYLIYIKHLHICIIFLEKYLHK